MSTCMVLLGFKADRIPRFGARCGLWLVRRSDLGWSPLPPSFLSSSPANNRAGEGLAVKEESAGWCGPQRSEDTALRALTDRHCGPRSRDQRWRRGKTDDRPTARDATDQRRAASAAACHRHALMGVDKVRSAKTASCTGRSGAACSAVLGGAKSARRVGVSRPLEASAARSFSSPPRTQQKGGKAPSGYNSLRSANDRIALPATIR
jgi:hypothetical protein